MSSHSLAKDPPPSDPASEQPGRHIVILGHMGVGKTTTAQALAKKLACSHSDSDVEIERLAGMAGSVVVERLGVPALHQLERAVLLAALAQPDRHIIAAAASVVESETVRQLLRKQFVVMIEADLDVIHARQSTSDHRRPMSIEELQSLIDRRAPLFAEVTDLQVDGSQPTKAIVATILTRAAERPSG